MTRSRSAPSRFHAAAFAALLVVAGAGPVASQAAAQEALPLPAVDEQPTEDTYSETIVLAGGCFWGVQGVFQHVDGVTSAVSGYAGGSRETAQVSSPTAASCKSIFPWCTTRPSSIAKAPISAHSIARLSSRKIPSRVGS